MVSKLVVLLGKKELKAARVVLYDDNTQEINEECIEAWNSKNLSEIFLHLKEKCQVAAIDVIIGDGLYLLDCVRVTTNVTPEQSEIETEAQKVLATSVDEMGVDYKLIRHKGSVWVYQIFVVKKTLLSLIGDAAKGAGLHVNSVKSEAQALAGSLFPQSGGFIVAWEDEKLNLGLGYKDELCLVRRVDFEHVYKQLKALLSLGAETYDIKVETIYMSKGSKILDKKKFKDLDVALSETEIDPFADNDIFGFDDETSDSVPASEIFPAEVFSQEPNDTKTTSSNKTLDERIIDPTSHAAPTPPLKLVEKDKPMEKTLVEKNADKSSTKLVVVIVTILVVLTGLVIGGVLVYRNALSNNSGQPQVIVSDATPVPQPTVNPAPEASVSGQPDTKTDTGETFDKSEIKIQVLNGSGIPGEAGKVSTLLKKDGFEDIDTSNASSFDFTDTQVSVKAEPRGLYQAIETALSKAYVVTKGNALSANAQYDVVITVGKDKP